MIEIKVQIDDWDTGESIGLTLPCDIRRYVDVTHDLYVVDWEGDINIGYYNDVFDLNDLIDDINTENPSMTFEILSAILKASGCGSLNNEEFTDKICESDFMLEEIVGVIGTTNEEKCARYLATEMMIPFAKNIDDTKLEEICRRAPKVNWTEVWKYYFIMGFQILTIDKKLYVFHWGDAVE